MKEVFSLRYPEGFESFVNHVVSWLSLEILGSLTGLECVVRNSFYDTLLIKTLVPIGILVILGGVVIGSRLRARHLVTQSPEAEHGSISKRHDEVKKVCFVIVLWLTYLVRVLSRFMLHRSIQ